MRFRGTFFHTPYGVVAVLLCLPTLCAQKPDPGKYSAAQYEVSSTRGNRVAMRDGIRLSVDIYQPVVGNGARSPAILMMTPYDNLSPSLVARSKWFAQRGYAMVLADVRGRYDSEGVWDPFTDKHKSDGYDLVEWIATQPWCDGKVGMMGGSYLGWTQWWTASQAPPHLKAIAPQVAPPSSALWNAPYQNGILASWPLDWGARMAGRVEQIIEPGPYGGFTNHRSKNMAHLPHRAWNDFDLAARLKAETGLPTFIENDGTAAVVAELFLGRGRELNDFLYVFIGSAAGGGVVIGGDYHRGAHSNAGDLGLMPTSPSRLSTAPEPTGRREILLTRASINALIRHLRGSGTPVTTRDELDTAIAAHPTLVDEWLDDCADALVDPLLAAVSVLDVEAVVLDGDLPRPVLESLVERLRRFTAAAAPEARQAPPIGLGHIGRQAAAIGAAILPLHVNYSPSRDLPSYSYRISNSRTPAAQTGRLNRVVALSSPAPS